MEISLISDSVTTIDHPNQSSHGLGFPKSFIRRLNFTHPSSPDQQRLEISAGSTPMDAVAPPPVKKATPKTLTRKRSRVKKRLKIDGFGADEGGGGSFLFGGIDGGFIGGGGGGFGGSGGGGGGGGGFNGFNWDESSSSSPADPAFDFVYEALSWFVLSNCLIFAFKRMARIVGDGVADPRTD
ncbi:hypothetical protein OSB04_029693 [Centaurea solstitialis]|uniref:Glycine-rich protein n=1 Tax=Centaurea solstitialis TaxID=347529 RepID=A0AA38W348_9ASTR|nr:hypothetical protein OSB04_029693 [Centaurea solstitialis]